MDSQMTEELGDNMLHKKANPPRDSKIKNKPSTADLSEEEMARMFLTLIHQECPGQLQIRTIHPTTNATKSYWPKSLDEAVRIALNQSDSWNVYFGVSTRRDQSSGKKSNVSHFPGVWVDLDFKDFEGGEEDAREKLEAFPLKPTLLVHSSGGFHPYFLLDEAIMVTPESLPMLEALNKAFATALGGDHCHSIEHILRIPGTMNFPDEKKRLRGRVPEPVRLLWHDGPRYTLKQLQEIVVNPSRENTAGKQNHSEGTTPPLPPRFLELLKHNPRIKATWEGDRKDLKDQTRSGYDMALTHQLVHHGFSKEDIKAILRVMPSGKGTEAKDLYHDLTIGKARSASDEDNLLPADLADQYLFDRQLQTEEGLRLRWHRETWLRYNGMTYDPIQMPDLIAHLAEYLRSSKARHKATKTFVGNVLLNLQAICVVDASVSLPVLETPDSWIESPNTLVVSNGILDLDDLLNDPTRVTLKSHTPLLISTIVLPFAYDPNAKCPRWQAFLIEILPDAASRLLLREIFGSCLTNDISWQKFFLFEGIGANGKGVVMIILTKMLGEANVSSIPLELFADTHGLEVTLGKLANIVSEIGELDRVAEGKLKQFTGGDLMHFNPKYKLPFSAKATAKLIIATNVRPQFRDRSDGLWRRLILLPFPISIPEMNQNRYLAEELAEELPGIFNWAVEGYRALCQRGHFLEPEVCRTAKDEFRRESNPAAMFLQEHCLYDPKTQSVTTVVYGDYERFCIKHGYKPLNDVNFGKIVRRIFPQVTRVKLSGTRHSRRPYIYRGLRLLNEPT